MRVLDRCLDTAGPGTGTDPGVAAAAARAKADPGMHDAISLLLAEEQETTSWQRWRRVLAAVRKNESGDCLLSLTERCDNAEPIRQVFISCKAAAEVAGEPDHQTAAALAELFLAAVVMEMSSLGTDEGRRLRNLAAHSDVATALTLWRGLADRQAPDRQRSGPDLDGTQQEAPGQGCQRSSLTSREGFPGSS